MGSLKWDSDEVRERRVGRGRAEAVGEVVVKDCKEASLPRDEDASVKIVEFVKDARGFIMAGCDGLPAVDSSEWSPNGLRNQRKMKKEEVKEWRVELRLQRLLLVVFGGVK